MNSDGQNTFPLGDDRHSERGPSGAGGAPLWWETQKNIQVEDSETREGGTHTTQKRGGRYTEKRDLASLVVAIS